ncbi:TetR/AcrR family transcriptional regulator C-terminal domain-containing protein [Micromonospora sp. NPDC050495]|uniref:TetR/AcrR family transcriptional regulator C-terminal domain-containing protein n=1 Tax=Micromonospora sp. NPDC050495 TaxID=3154936 RepID=UPI0033F50275
MPASRTRGQRAGITRQAILQAALRLADREGLAALSMRRLGAELGVEAMTLYHHVPNKNALLDGMVEHVASEANPPSFGNSSWREELRDYAHSLLAALSAHPNVVPLFMSQPAVTPQNLRTMEAALETLCAAGFEPRRALDVVYSLTEFVLGHAAIQVGAARAGQDGPGRAASLSAVDQDAYPLLSQAARADQKHGTMSRFDFTLEALLSGFDTARSVPHESERQRGTAS